MIPAIHVADSSCDLRVPSSVTETIRFRTVGAVGGDTPPTNVRSVDFANEIPPGLRSFVIAGATKTAIKQVLSDDLQFDDDELPPSSPTVDAATRYLDSLVDVGITLKTVPTVGTFYGELSLTWIVDVRRLTLIFPGHATPAIPSLYHERKDPGQPLGHYEIEKQVEPEKAPHWFRWLYDGVFQGQMQF